MEELRDIQGLDHISWWPLAMAWWIIIGLLGLVIVCGLIYLYKRYRYKNSWQYGFYMTFGTLQRQLTSRNNLAENELKQLVDQLAIEIRRMAIHKYARESCAGLIGKNWLTWLQQNDPVMFDWTTNGQLLIEYQYMPEIGSIDKDKIVTLIEAAKRWVNKC